MVFPKTAFVKSCALWRYLLKWILFVPDTIYSCQRNITLPPVNLQQNPHASVNNSSISCVCYNYKQQTFLRSINLTRFWTEEVSWSLPISRLYFFQFKALSKSSFYTVCCSFLKRIGKFNVSVIDRCCIFLLEKLRMCLVTDFLICLQLFTWYVISRYMYVIQNQTYSGFGTVTVK